MSENKVGRPTVMTEETVNKLEEIFALGGSDREACFYANISKQTLYDYQEKHPEFIDRKEALKETPILKARREVVKGLSNYQNAMDFLKRKRKKEFSERIENDITSGDEKLNQVLVKFIDGKDNQHTNRVSEVV